MGEKGRVFPLDYKLTVVRRLNAAGIGVIRNRCHMESVS